MPKVIALDTLHPEKLRTERVVKSKVRDGEWKLFAVAVRAKASLLSVTLKGEPDDKLDLYLFPPDARDTSQWQVAPKSRFSLEGALVEKPEAGSWRIGVFGSKVKLGDFRIVADTKGRDYVKKGLQVTW